MADLTPDLNASLLALFEKLRRQDVPLGVSDYLDAIEAIQSGLGLENPDKFKQLLRLLWTKSREDQERFDGLFDNQFEQFFQAVEAPTPEVADVELPTPQGDDPPSRGTIPPIGITTQPLDPPVIPNPQPGQGESAEKVQKPTPLLAQPSKPAHRPAAQHYQFIPHFPISQRDMAGAWRQLRRPQRVGVPEELDVEATIASLARSGGLVSPVLRPRRRNLSRLVVLVDRQGSMTPFHPWIDAAMDSIKLGGLLGRVSFYYFHDCPETFLYRQPDLTGILRLETVLEEQVRGGSVLIISDAGAARGYFDSLRLSDTKAFLHKLQVQTYLYAWINPMPKQRWVATTAEDVACLVPMFPLDREGLNDAVNILRGQPFPVGVGLHEPN
ncbi:MAG: VWA domain-containing protein [Pegethrix bostrychoides GSE-TBD4-15B]|jgi:hypothetical protein|uniref:VWA domain-containing protein n=1 Tax=Pegethrix bostrychoides GSE-TBD4-15B TaxID=2839662 RepID=A0A951PA54_9CYAN|nr:VWA domain-containing protein [Pegethrix bostrychoides GSE-TBD4-15B]